MRGRFKRLYVVMWVAWGLWCLYWPIYSHQLEWDRWNESRMAVFRSCLDDSPRDTSPCWKEVNRSLNADLKLSADSYPYGSSQWKFTILFVAGLALIPPLLLYGTLFKALPWLAKWVWVGTAKKEVTK